MTDFEKKLQKLKEDVVLSIKTGENPEKIDELRRVSEELRGFKGRVNSLFACGATPQDLCELINKWFLLAVHETE